MGFTCLVRNCFNAFLGGTGRSFLVIFEYKSSYRANFDTLVADVACRLSDRLVLKCSYYPIEAAVCKSQHTYSEALTARPYTPVAQDTLIGVVDKVRAARIYSKVVHQLPETLGIYLDIENRAELLELARTILCTVSTVHRMAGQKKLQSGASQPPSLRALSIDHHTLGDRLCASGDRAVSPLYLHEAEPTAGKRLRSFLYCAQIRYVNPVVQCRPEHLLPLAGYYLFAVDGQRYCLHSPNLWQPAPSQEATA